VNLLYNWASQRLLWVPSQFSILVLSHLWRRRFGRHEFVLDARRVPPSTRQGDRVMVFVICSIAVAAGIGCAFVRYPVLLLIAVCPLLAAGTLLGGIRFGTPAELIAVEVFGSLAAPQVTFMAISLAHFAFRRHLARYFARSSKLIPQVRTFVS
jgi:hypothetical protein